MRGDRPPRRSPGMKRVARYSPRLASDDRKSAILDVEPVCPGRPLTPGFGSHTIRRYSQNIYCGNCLERSEHGAAASRASARF